jgi:hypothetical protein
MINEHIYSPIFKLQTLVIKLCLCLQIFHCTAKENLNILSINIPFKNKKSNLQVFSSEFSCIIALNKAYATCAKVAAAVQCLLAKIKTYLKK